MKILTGDHFIVFSDGGGYVEPYGYYEDDYTDLDDEAGDGLHELADYLDYSGSYFFSSRVMNR